MTRKSQTNANALTTQTATAAAVLQVKTWIIEGQQAADILESITKHYPRHRPDVLLGAALQELGDEAAELDTNAARGFLLNAYRELYRRALEINDFAAALAALKSFERQIPKTR